MILWDICHGLGTTIIDPHGGLIEEVLHLIPRKYTNKVIYLNPQDPHHTIGINVFESVSPDQQPLVVSSIISILKNIWSENWGPRTEYICSNASYALLSQPEPQTLVAIPKLLTNKEYRDRIAAHITDPAVREFFDIYDNHWRADQREKAAAPLCTSL